MNFRNSRYRKYCFMGKRTVKDGECCSLWGQTGKQTLVYGPKLQSIWRSRVTFLDRIQAGPSEYLRIQSYKDGSVTHRLGPIEIFINPVEHSNVSKLSVLHLEGSQLIVVYKPDEKDGSIEKRVVKGPIEFMPQPDEWIHSFSWHGPQEDNNCKFDPKSRNFEKLSMSPEQMYFDVLEARTSDDVIVKIQTMIFFEIEDPEILLETCDDPVGEIINFITTDVIDFTSKYDYERFADNATQLNDMCVYKLLTKRMSEIGVKISKIAFRGYEAESEFQNMKNLAMGKINKSRLEIDAQVQKQQAEDIRLQGEIRRAQQNRDLDKEENANKILEIKLKGQAEVEEQRKQNDAQIAQLQQTYQRELEHIAQFVEAGVDPNQYYKACHAGASKNQIQINSL